MISRSHIMHLHYCTVHNVALLLFVHIGSPARSIRLWLASRKGRRISRPRRCRPRSTGGRLAKESCPGSSATRLSRTMLLLLNHLDSVPKHQSCYQQDPHPSDFSVFLIVIRPFVLPLFYSVRQRHSSCTTCRCSSSTACCPHSCASPRE